MKKNVKMIDRKKNFLFVEKKTARLERIVDRAKAKKRDSIRFARFDSVINHRFRIRKPRVHPGLND